MLCEGHSPLVINTNRVSRGDVSTDISAEPGTVEMALPVRPAPSDLAVCAGTLPRCRFPVQTLKNGDQGTGYIAI